MRRRKLEQDPDVLDTWFSSGLWPLSTLGWPDETADLREFYPTTLLISGYDILFFWDARMVMMCLHLAPGKTTAERIPFRTLYLHSLVRDAQGQKMSKMRGNVVDPLEWMEKHGTDALRFTLAIKAAPGTDIALSEDAVMGYRAFANKIWNAARFVFLNLEKLRGGDGKSIEELAAPEMRAAAPYPMRERCWQPRGSLDFLAARRSRRHSGRRAGEFPFSRSGARRVSLLLGRLLRLVYRVDEAGDGGRGSRGRRAGVAKSFRGVRGSAAAAASVHAVSDRGVVASAAAAFTGKRQERAIDRSAAVPAARAAMVRPRRG